MVVAAERGDRAACRQLVDHYLPAIAGVAQRFERGGGVQHAELMQEGVAGLLFAARRYDPRMETPFWAYASFWVRKGMQEMVADVTHPVALSDHAVRGLALIRAARREHLEAHAAEPTMAELADATGLAPAQLESLLATERRPRSFDEIVPHDAVTTATLRDQIADPDAEIAYDHLLDEMEVLDFAGLLDDRERTVLWSHYGIDQRTPETLSTIGARLGLTAERVRQIEADALEKLRTTAAEEPAT
ncbi:MAG TPA: sigma-70 family RNA polymerase sigma factor [Solirubrobacteraceae bacterium]|nr:sigma-70 family RNA polymerase sigma factor [Solirubrobacteraceae bacterium]